VSAELVLFRKRLKKPATHETVELMACRQKRCRYQRIHDWTDSLALFQGFVSMLRYPGVQLRFTPSYFLKACPGPSY